MIMLYRIMKAYSVEYTRQNFASLLRELPFAVTRYGKVICKVVGPSSTNVVQDTSGSKTPFNMPNTWKAKFK